MTTIANNQTDLCMEICMELLNEIMMLDFICFGCSFPTRLPAAIVCYIKTVRASSSELSFV